ncbi:PREDICTED: recQ-mediated genome instability protein 1-like [Dufourea novaeangliae]|uniref:recQ-mediated genome instability protein 1-like n=1 Tax=Dufourea novaeangliae TaxID=178035 RepID=UPI0007676796|nr:PREDICTED: recQ-mediated genome instability protein 1-like [Dufourea novaeangliae]
MNEDLFKRTKADLKSEFYLMNDDWLRDCIEFYVDQHKNPSNQEILQFVKVQWQLSDLREISNKNGCLPCNITQHKSIILSGNYILQVEQMYDISTSKYKQLQQIRNTHVSEVDPTEAEELEKWEPPKKRMMQLKMTDGLQDVIGIEYKQISRLNDILPGYKVMIIGPVRCRKGVLFLEEGKLRGIGGEVDSLLIPNALENVLARALKLEENLDPYNDNASKSNNVKQQKEARLEDSFFEEEFEINLEEVSKIEHSLNKDHKQLNVNSCRTEPVKENIMNTNIPKKNVFSCKVEPAKENVIATNIEKKDNYSFRVETRKENCITINVDEKDHNCKDNKILDDDDCFLEMVDEEQLVVSQPELKNIATPFRALPKENDDDIIVINDEDMLEDISYESVQKPVKKTENTSHVNSTCFTSKAVSSNIIPHLKGHAKPLETSINNAIFQIPMSPPDPVTLKKGRIDRKMTEFIKRPHSPDTKICDFIHDINNEIITEPTCKTIRGRVEVLGKLSKKDSSWILDATIIDGTANIKVNFSNQVLQNLLGFSVQEFSLKKKLKKNPEIEHELRMSFRSAEQQIKTLDDLLELELDVNKKPIVNKITNLTPKQKELIDKQLKSFLNKNSI